MRLRLNIQHPLTNYTMSYAWCLAFISPKELRLGVFLFLLHFWTFFTSFDLKAFLNVFLSVLVGSNYLLVLLAPIGLFSFWACSEWLYLTHTQFFDKKVEFSISEYLCHSIRNHP